MSFIKDFAWGAATSSYQIEGAHSADGKGKSIWDLYCDKKGAIADGSDGNVACDHYNRYKEDVKMMSEMGLQTYRFSLSWTRILPKGTGEVNQKGIEFYNNLIDELLKYNITPHITLFHWDYPLELYYKGGWLNEESSDWFANYATIVVQNFSDRVKHFITFNEPQCIVGCGYRDAVHAPGLNVGDAELVRIGHNLMLAHGKAVIAMRTHGANDIKIGYAPTCSFPYPEAEKDIEAARNMCFEINYSSGWTWNNTWWSDPVILGEYPKDGLALFEKYLPSGWEDDIKIINQPLDTFYLNIYTGYKIRTTEDGTMERVPRELGYTTSSLGWPIDPECIRWATKFLYERYKLPIYISENGRACLDEISFDGEVHDPERINYIHSYLRELKKSSEEGADIRGYFCWSLMDNFEWSFGYGPRFGLVYVDYKTQKRIPKDSAKWYKTVIECNGENL